MQSLLNTITIRFLSPHSRWSLIAFAIPLLAIGLLQVSTVSSQDLDSMPWMDQESGDLSPVGISGREPSLTHDRSSVPLKPVKLTANPAPGPAFNPTGPSLLSSIGPVLVYGLAILATVLVLGLAIWALLNSRVDVGVDKFPARSDRTLAESIRHLPFEMDASQGDFRQQAQAAYQAGDYRKALVFLFSHVLVTLDQAKLVRLKKGKTNRQYLRELSPSRSLVNYYGDVMVPFEQTFFGDYPITKEAFESCWQGLDDFQRSVDTARSKASRSTPTLSNIIHTNAVGPSTAEGAGR